MVGIDMRFKKLLRNLIGLGALLVIVAPFSVRAQVDSPGGALYEVKGGDNLWEIAVRFNVSLDELAQVNEISESSQIAPGDRLLIPGVQGYDGLVDTITVPFGETLLSLSRRYQVPMATLVQLNRLTNPVEVFAGKTLILPSDRIQNINFRQRTLIPPGLSTLEIAVLNNTNPWSIVRANQLAGTWAALPGDVLHTRTTGTSGPGALPEPIMDLQINSSLIAQGDTIVVQVAAPPGIMISGSLAGRALRFFPFENDYVALQGIHALQEPGLYLLTIKGTLPAGEPAVGTSFSFSQSLLIRDGNYPYDPVLIVDPETLDPAITAPEDELWNNLGTPVSPDKRWTGLFQSPVPPEFKACWTSLFGNRRSYNGGPYDYFHTGLDFCGGIGTELYAPADGEVVFTGSLTVRGNATVIDHGWGIFTAYDHQSEIFVKPGDFVQAGQLIGLGGATGRVTGPHLHWEVWVGGVQVDPESWLNTVYP